MSNTVLFDRRLFFGGYDLTGDSNSIVFSLEADAVDFTTFEDTFRQRKPGLTSHALQAKGFFNAARADPALFGSIGATGQWITVAAENAAAPGSRSYFFQAVSGDYSPGGAVGDQNGFDFGAVGTGRAYRGILLAHETGLFENGVATGYQLGAVSSGQTIACLLHVLSVNAPGDEITVTLESDDNAGFTSATTRATFSGFSAIGAELQAAAGAITDDYWRLAWAVTGSTPSFTIAASLAIY